jgi:hypothetical protein
MTAPTSDRSDSLQKNIFDGPPPRFAIFEGWPHRILERDAPAADFRCPSTDSPRRMLDTRLNPRSWVSPLRAIKLRWEGSPAPAVLLARATPTRTSLPRDLVPRKSPIRLPHLPRRPRPFAPRSRGGCRRWLRSASACALRSRSASTAHRSCGVRLGLRRKDRPHTEMEWIRKSGRCFSLIRPRRDVDIRSRSD